MKILITLSLLIGSVDAALAEKIYLKQTYSNYNADRPRQIRCRFYSNSVEITTSTGTESSQRFLRTHVSGVELAILTAKAAKEKLYSAADSTCGGVDLAIEGFEKNGDSFLIRMISECANRKYFRKGESSKKLLGLVKKYCRRLN